MNDELNSWLKKIEEVRKGRVDLSSDEDLSIALMNLISLEEHFYFTAMKTDDVKYVNLLKSVRKLRTNLMKKIVVNPKGEEWCISKHLLASSMRLMEVGTKELSKNNMKEANTIFRYAFDLYSLFFAINLKMIDSKKLEAVSESNEGAGVMQKFSKIVKAVVNCCKEW